jgi:membrane glycosyltransferase
VILTYHSCYLVSTLSPFPFLRSHSRQVDDMNLSHRLLRGVATLGMMGGTVLLLAAGLTLIRPGLTGVLADIVPNLPMAPAVPVVAAAMIVGSAWTRRRFLHSSRPASPRPHEELKPTASPSTLVD